MKSLVAALQILMKYDPDGMVGGADHDIIYLSYVDPDKVSAEDTDTLDKLGCHVQDDGWCMFV